jgi:AhpD family alkylhydroperoxidase
MGSMSKSRKCHELDSEFIERIMLAVTEVNGCEVCSYAHTKMALEQGFSQEEIQLLLSGDTSKVPAEEGSAIMFAQHYADSRGRPSPESWLRLSEVYGDSKAKGILGAIRIITMGNAFGIPYSALRSRIKGKPIARSSPGYELIMLLSVPFFMPAALLHALMANLLKRPLINHA